MTEETDASEGEAAATFVAFAGATRIASGSLAEAAVAAKRALDREAPGAVLVFNGETGAVVDLDLRGSEQDVAARLAPPAAETPRRGRPKLGVTPREVTLLPRHWEWLARQPGGASVALRKLVEAARKLEGEADRARTRREAAYRFMSAIGGDLPGFEEAARALFAGDLDQLGERTAAWPADIRDQTLRLAAPS